MVKKDVFCFFEDLLLLIDFLVLEFTWENMPWQQTRRHFRFPAPGSASGCSGTLSPSWSSQ